MDINSLFAFIADQGAMGIMVGEQSLNATFTGGLFSLDGIHPSSVGYGIIANAFLEKINARIGPVSGFGGFSAAIPFLSAEEILNPGGNEQ